jgi:hypothetical protein
MIHHSQRRMNGACLWVIGSVHQTADAGVNGCPGAHGARLNCSKQFAAAKAVITNGASGLAQRYYFSVGGWIVVAEVAIPSAPDYASFADNYGADGNFSGVKRALGAA